LKYPSTLPYYKSISVRHLGRDRKLSQLKPQTSQGAEAEVNGQKVGIGEDKFCRASLSLWVKSGGVSILDKNSGDSGDTNLADTTVPGCNDMAGADMHISGAPAATPNIALMTSIKIELDERVRAMIKI
jgi:hypothetical protein